MKFNKTTLLKIAPLPALILVGLFFFARYAGERAAKADIERIELLVPNVLGLPQEDRVLFATLSLECNLQSKPLAAYEVEPCLTEAAKKLEENGKLPDATQHLQKLLSQHAKSS